MKKKWFLGMAAIVFVVLLLVIVNSKNSSSFDYPPSESLVCSTEVKEYPLNTAGFPITVTNVGEYSGEIHKPFIEVWSNGSWYRVKGTPEENKTMELLSVSPNETKDFYVSLSTYESNLKPGHYRAVFAFTLNNDYFSFEFDLL